MRIWQLSLNATELKSRFHSSTKRWRNQIASNGTANLDVWLEFMLQINGLLPQPPNHTKYTFFKDSSVTITFLWQFLWFPLPYPTLFRQPRFLPPCVPYCSLHFSLSQHLQPFRALTVQMSLRLPSVKAPWGQGLCYISIFPSISHRVWCSEDIQHTEWWKSVHGLEHTSRARNLYSLKYLLICPWWSSG